MLAERALFRRELGSMTRKAKRAAKKAPAALGDPVVAGNIRSKLAERGLCRHI